MTPISQSPHPCDTRLWHCGLRCCVCDGWLSSNIERQALKLSDSWWACDSCAAITQQSMKLAVTLLQDCLYVLIDIFLDRQWHAPALFPSCEPCRQMKLPKENWMTHLMWNLFEYRQGWHNNPSSLLVRHSPVLVVKRLLILSFSLIGSSLAKGTQSRWQPDSHPRPFPSWLQPMPG